MCTMQSCSILIVAEGVSPFQPLIQDVPQIYKNLILRIVLDDDWQKGVANYQFCIDNVWHEVEHAKVEIIIDSESQDIKKLASIVMSKGKEPVA